MIKQSLGAGIQRVNSKHVMVKMAVDNEGEDHKSLSQKISTTILWLSGAFTAVMMVACGTLLVAQISNEYIAYQEFSKQAYIIMMLSYVLLLATSTIDSKLNEA